MSDLWWKELSLSLFVDCIDPPVSTSLGSMLRPRGRPWFSADLRDFPPRDAAEIAALVEHFVKTNIPAFAVGLSWIDTNDDGRSDDTHEEWRRLNDPEAK